MVLIYHGDGGTGAGIESYCGFDAVADANNFIAVYPNSNGAGGWDRAIGEMKDVNFTSDLIDYFCTTYQINTSKVYATGHSAGGFMTYNLAASLGNKIAAFAPVSGDMYSNIAGFNFTNYFASAAYTPVPIYHIHGDVDNVVTYEDPNNIPDPWGEWPLFMFSNANCGTNTYSSPQTTIVAGVNKLNFCTQASGKEVSLIRIIGGGHNWPNVTGYNAAQSIWNFFNNYTLPYPQICIPSLINNNTIHIAGKYILDPCNDTLKLKGINYAPYNWGNDLTNLKINQIAQTGANVVRLVWYKDVVNGVVYNNYNALDSVLSKCVQNKLMVILELHDNTCSNNTTNLIADANWFTSASVLPILLKYKQSLIINIANEALNYSFDANPSAALTTYRTTYQTIITNLRSVSSFIFPIMIDAPDCGSNSDAFITNNTAQNIITSDPLHNVIFSAHAYWYLFANNDSATMATKINNVIAQNIPFIMGEVANQQDDANPCQYSLNYKPLLNFLNTKNIGWLAWSWDNDICSNRQISTNGNYNSLSTYGQDIVNNANYGLQNNTTKSKYLLYGNICSSSPLSIPNVQLTLTCNDNKIQLFYSTTSITTYQLLASNNLQNWDVVETNSFNNLEGNIYINKK